MTLFVHTLNWFNLPLAYAFKAFGEVYVWRISVPERFLKRFHLLQFKGTDDWTAAGAEAHKIAQKWSSEFLEIPRAKL